MRQSPCAVLGVPKESTQEEIKKKFFEEARKWHPDKWQNHSQEDQSRAHEQFVKLHAAYEALTGAHKNHKGPEAAQQPKAEPKQNASQQPKASQQQTAATMKAVWREQRNLLMEELYGAERPFRAPTTRFLPEDLRKSKEATKPEDVPKEAAKCEQDSQLLMRLQQLLAEDPNLGYRSAHAKLKEDGDLRMSPAAFQDVALKKVQTALQQLKAPAPASAGAGPGEAGSSKDLPRAKKEFSKDVPKEAAKCEQASRTQTETEIPAASSKARTDEVTAHEETPVSRKEEELWQESRRARIKDMRRNGCFWIEKGRDWKTLGARWSG
eukprot:s227_g25.t1